MTTDQGPRYAPVVLGDNGRFTVAPWSATSAEWSPELDALAAEWRTWTRALSRSERAGAARAEALAMLRSLRALCARLTSRTAGLDTIKRRARTPRTTWPPGRLAVLASPANGPPAAIRAGPPFALLV